MPASRSVPTMAAVFSAPMLSPQTSTFMPPSCRARHRRRRRRLLNVLTNLPTQLDHFPQVLPDARRIGDLRHAAQARANRRDAVLHFRAAVETMQINLETHERGFRVERQRADEVAAHNVDAGQL